MKKSLYGLLAVVGMAACSQPDRELILHYDRPADHFEQALPLGNGRLGAMVYGGTQEERISLNDITLWTGEPDRGERHPDIAAGIGQSAAQAIPLIREALRKEDYPAAEELQRQVQGHFSESYQPLGTLRIRHEDSGDISDYRRELDLSKATATTTFLRNGKSFRTDCFVSAPDSVIV